MKAFWDKRINAIFSVCFEILVVLNLIDSESDQGWSTRLSPASESQLSRIATGNLLGGDVLRLPAGERPVLFHALANDRRRYSEVAALRQSSICT